MFFHSPPLMNYILSCTIFFIFSSSHFLMSILRSCRRCPWSASESSFGLFPLGAFLNWNRNWTSIGRRWCSWHGTHRHYQGKWSSQELDLCRGVLPWWCSCYYAHWQCQFGIIKIEGPHRNSDRTCIGRLWCAWHAAHRHCQCDVYLSQEFDVTTWSHQVLSPVLGRPQWKGCFPVACLYVPCLGRLYVSSPYISVIEVRIFITLISFPKFHFLYLTYLKDT